MPQAPDTTQGFLDLPDNVISRVLGHLHNSRSIRALWTLRGVNSRLRRLASHPSLWTDVACTRSPTSRDPKRLPAKAAASVLSAVGPHIKTLRLSLATQRVCLATSWYQCCPRLRRLELYGGGKVAVPRCKDALAFRRESRLTQLILHRVHLGTGDLAWMLSRNPKLQTLFLDHCSFASSVADRRVCKCLLELKVHGKVDPDTIHGILRLFPKLGLLELGTDIKLPTWNDVAASMPYLFALVANVGTRADAEELGRTNIFKSLSILINLGDEGSSERFLQCGQRRIVYGCAKDWHHDSDLGDSMFSDEEACCDAARPVIHPHIEGGEDVTTVVGMDEELEADIDYSEQWNRLKTAVWAGFSV